MNYGHNHAPRGSSSRAKWVFFAFVAIAAYFLIAEHRAHLSGLLYYLPFLLLLLCPLMHIFMHRGHHQHGSDHENKHARTRETRDTS
jgi:hypothetical protein